MAAPTPQQLTEALREVLDPELGESIVDLGLVQHIEVGDCRVDVTLIPTSATCPMADVLVDDASAALRRCVPPRWEVEVMMDFDQTWSPQRLSPALRARFGWPGSGS